MVIEKKAKNHKEFINKLKTFSDNHRLMSSDYYEDNESPYSKGYAKDNEKIIIKFEHIGTGNKSYWIWKWKHLK